jgi:hypothetical protein
MDRQMIILVVAFVLTLIIFIIGLSTLFRRRETGRLSKHIVATITQIQVEAGGLSSWWVVTAQWLDTQTGQIITFRSPHLKFRPHKHIGEDVTVDFDPNIPTHYRMEL